MVLPMKIFISNPLWALPNPLFLRILWFIRKPKWWVERHLFLLAHERWAVRIGEAFVTLGGQASWTSKRHPRAPKLVVRLRKVCESSLRLRKERIKIVDWGSGWKRLGLELTFVNNPSFLNGEVDNLGASRWTSANKSLCSSFDLHPWVLV
jgi:hypothetical protein